MKKCIFPFILFAFVLFACGGRTTKVPDIIITTITEMAAITATTSPLPTPTPGSSISTPTLNPTLQIAASLYKQTQEANDLSAQATQQAINGFKKTFNGMCDSMDLQTSLSPYGNWLAQDCPLDRFQVIKKDNFIIWAVKYEQIFESMEGAGSIFPVYWSKDGRYLYFTQVGCCADNDSMRIGNMLYRMDLGTGEWKMVINGYFNHYSFSPTGRKLMYILNDQAATGNPLVVHIMDLTSGSEMKFNFPNLEQAGMVIWKQDGIQLTMTAKTGNVFDENELFSIIEINLKENSSRIIIQDSKDELKVVQWADNDVLTVEKHSYYESSGQYYDIAEQTYYDLNSSQFVTSTPPQ